MRGLRVRAAAVDSWLLERFNRWFCSQGGVWQTALITLAIVVLEATGSVHDTHGFWLLYWLTVYSAITQPALAHAGAVAAEQMEGVLARLEGLEVSHAKEMAAVRRELRRLERAVTKGALR